MTDDLRDQIAQVILAHFAPPEGPGESWRLNPTAAADALLARFAIAGELPEPDPDYAEVGTRWDVDPGNPRVYLSGTGQIDFAGPCYWSTRKGDDPRPFAAALIAAYRKAQEQTHE